MKRPGQVAIMRFPSADLRLGKPRPVLLLAPVPGAHEDWLVCRISSQLRHEATGFDEVIRKVDGDFDGSGLKVVSLIRLRAPGRRFGGDARRSDRIHLGRTPCGCPPSPGRLGTRRAGERIPACALTEQISRCSHPEFASRRCSPRIRPPASKRCPRASHDGPTPQPCLLPLPTAKSAPLASKR